MKILVDQNLALGVAVSLRSLGYDAVRTSELDKARTEDIDLIALARVDGYVIATCDFDFHEILAKSNAMGPSVILLRTRSLSPTYLAGLIHEACDGYGDELAAGCLLTHNGRRIRFQKLPFRISDRKSLPTI